jgi:hypothetical protein
MFECTLATIKGNNVEICNRTNEGHAGFMCLQTFDELDMHTQASAPNCLMQLPQALYCMRRDSSVRSRHAGDACNVRDRDRRMQHARVLPDAHLSGRQVYLFRCRPRL